MNTGVDKFDPILKIFKENDENTAQNATKPFFRRRRQYFSNNFRVLLIFKLGSYFSLHRSRLTRFTKNGDNLNYKRGIVRILRGERNPHLTPCASERVEICLHCPS